MQTFVVRLIKMDSVDVFDDDCQISNKIWNVVQVSTRVSKVVSKLSVAES